MPFVWSRRILNLTARRLTGGRPLALRCRTATFLVRVTDLVSPSVPLSLLSPTQGIKRTVRSELVQGRAPRKRRLHPQELYRDESPPVSILPTFFFVFE